MKLYRHTAKSIFPLQRSRAEKSGRILCFVLLFLCAVSAARAAEPFTLLIGVPQSDQIARFADQVAGGMTTVPAVRFVPGLGGAYALRDNAADPTSVAVFSLPELLLSRDDPNSPAHRADLEVLFLAARVPVALWVPESSDLKTPADLIALARKGGVPVICAGPGRFTAPHMASVVFNREAGVQTLFLPLLGTDEARKAAIQGRVQAVWAYALVPGSLPGMRPLAVAADSRSPVLPQTPTFAEVGITVNAWAELGFSLSPKAKNKAGAGAALKDSLTDSYTRDALAAQGFFPPSTPDEALPLYLDEQAAKLRRFKLDYPALLD